MTAKSNKMILRIGFVCLLMVCATQIARAADPGLPFPSDSEMSDQKAGSLLVFNYYSSSPISALQENSRVSITNTNSLEGTTIHLYFIDGATCSVADTWLCLPPNCTSTFSMAEVDPGTSGYLVAIASDGPTGFRSGGNTGAPVSFNHLVGDVFLTLASGHKANLGAVAFAVVDSVIGVMQMVTLFWVRWIRYTTGLRQRHKLSSMGYRGTTIEFPTSWWSQVFRAPPTA